MIALNMKGGMMLHNFLTNVSIVVKGKKHKCDINKHMNKSCSKNTSCSITCKWCEKEVMGMPMLLEHLQEELETKGSYICRDCHLVYGKITEVMKHQQSNECTKIRT